MPQPIDRRPDNPSVESEDHRDRPSPSGPPRPSTEPKGAKDSVTNPHTETDPGTGEQKT